MMIKTTRRGFLAGLLASPAIVHAGVIMPVRSIILPAPSFLPGDLVQVTRAAFYGGPFVGARVVLRVEGNTVVTHANSFYGDARDEAPVRREVLELFEGLPGNRVDNPSMMHRLVRNPSGLGLSYREDFTA